MEENYCNQAGKMMVRLSSSVFVKRPELPTGFIRSLRYFGTLNTSKLRTQGAFIRWLSSSVFWSVSPVAE
jgi:hypothetical protein